MIILIKILAVIGAMFVLAAIVGGVIAIAICRGMGDDKEGE